MWQKGLAGASQSWIEVGQPEEKRLLKAAGRSEQVLVFEHPEPSDAYALALLQLLKRLE